VKAAVGNHLFKGIGKKKKGNKIFKRLKEDLMRAKL